MRTRLLLYKKFCIIFVVLWFQCKEQGGANVGIKAQRYRAFYQHIAGMEVGETAVWWTEDWENGITVWRQTLRETGLYSNEDGSYSFGGKKVRMNHLFFPERLSEFYAELGKNEYIWENVICIKVEYTGIGVCITHKKRSAQMGTGEVAELFSKKNDLDRKIADRIIRQYLLSLYAIRMSGFARYCLLTAWSFERGVARYQFEKILTDFEAEPPSKNGMALVDGDIACIFFSATVFSLLKTPLRRMKILTKDDTEFALYVYSLQSVDREHFEDYLECLDSYADLFCNFRKWGRKKLTKSFNGAKFRITEDEPANLLAWWNHLCFPIVFADYPREQDMEENVHYPSADEPKVRYRRKDFENLSCVPILLRRQSALGRAATAKNILSLSCESSKIEKYSEWFDWDEERVRCKHNRIMDGYLRFLSAINDMDSRQFKEICKRAKKRADEVVGLNCLKSTDSQWYCGSMLCALYVALECGGENIPFISSVKAAIRYLQKNTVRFAVPSDFARFIRCCIDENHEVLFYQDANGIYLYYKKYWPAFQKYCKRHGVILSDSAAQFRRTKLNGYIKPQYTVSGSKYPRYDYRKKVDGVEATVLNVHPNILKLAGS